MSDYENELKKHYPERCLKILARNADDEMHRATKRNQKMKRMKKKREVK